MTRANAFAAPSLAALSAALAVATPAAAQRPAPPPPPVSSSGALPSSAAEAASTDARSTTNEPVVPPTVPDAVAPPAAEAASAGEIVVTGSRIAIAGYQQPTPVTVVNEAILQRDARPTIGDSIRELPAVGSSSSPTNTAGAANIVAGITGLDTVNLRQLGVTRTLVLFDGQRVVQSNVTGEIDIGTIPTALVQRIDVVTGGASAAWGSDAVSGVVNLVLNKSFDGVRASAEVGESYEFDRTTYRVSLAAGAGFADGRGRVIVAANHFGAPDAVFANQRSWNRYRMLVNNPAFTATNAEPRLIHADNVNLAGATTGGLIVGPTCLVPVVAGACARPNTLMGQQFVGPAATLAPYPVTNVSGQVGANAETLQGSLNNLAIDYKTTSLFGFTSFQFADWLKASVQLNYGTTYSRNNSVPFIRIGAQAVPIRIDNPFLPDAVRAQMTGLGLSQISVGTTNINNVTEDSLSYDNFIDNAVGVPVATTKRTLKRGVFSLDGDFGGGWSWNGYYQRGEVKVVQRTQSNAIIANYNRAVDAVRNAAGQVVCRVNADATATNDDPACRPLNILGTGVASVEAIEYVNVKLGQNFQVQDLTQNVVALSAQGTLPFGLPAGDIAVAFGAERRTEKGRIRNDDGAFNRVYSVANFPRFFGAYNVEEAFLELDAPIVEDGFVDSLSFNAAGRVTWYSTSGQVETWKVGLLSQVTPDLRVRGIVSRDIRAPNLNNLFSAGLSTLNSAVDPRTGGTVAIFTNSSGNPNLTPEIAQTYSGGIVLTPRFLPRFSLSVDYYSINIDDAISTIGANQTLNRCVAGELVFCDQLVFNGPNGALSEIKVSPLNVASLKTSGIDFQADYSLPVGAGSLSARLLGNYTIRQSQNQTGETIRYDGAIGADSPIGGFPKARGTFALTYSQDALSLTAQSRFIGGAKLVRTWTSKDVDDNTIPAIAYVDLRGSYQITEAVQVFGTVDNLLNQDPPNIAAGPAQGQSAYYFTAANGVIYDVIGRQYRAGVRLRF